MNGHFIITYAKKNRKGKWVAVNEHFSPKFAITRVIKRVWEIKRTLGKRLSNINISVTCNV